MVKVLLGTGLLFIFLLSQICQAQQDYFLGEVKVNSNPLYTQIHIPIPEGTGYVVGERKDPPQILMNLYPIETNLPFREIVVADKFIQKICLVKDSKSVVKAIVDLNTPEYNFDIFSQEKPKAVVIEIRPPRKDIVTALLEVEDAVGLEAEERSLSFGPWQQVPEKKEGIFRITIDPGHGGKDPGAIGPSGVKEKDITLAIAIKLFNLLKKNSQIEVYLTREDDKFIPLDRRTEIANLVKGDLFISIHANAAWDSQVRGMETFYNSRYAYGEGAEKVATRENIALTSDGLPSTIKNIIWDLIQNQYRQESKELSHIVQEKIVQICEAPNRGVKSAPFYVLRGASMPAILVEVGFISNPWEERKLKNPQFQELVASGIYQGIIAYINSFNRKINKVNH